MEIDSACPKDRSDVVALWERAGLTRPWNDANADFDRALGSQQSTVFKASDEGALVGSVMVGDDGHRGWLYYLAVDETARRRGIGAALVAEAEQWLALRGQTTIRLMVREGNSEVWPFYEGLGYVDQSCAVLGRTID